MLFKGRKALPQLNGKDPPPKACGARAAFATPIPCSWVRICACDDVLLCLAANSEHAADYADRADDVPFGLHWQAVR